MKSRKSLNREARKSRSRQQKHARIAIVHNSTIGKYRRIDPEFYLGAGVSELEHARQLEAEADRLRQRAADIRANRAKNLARIRRMEKKGEVTRIV